MSTNTELTLRMSDIPAFKNGKLLNLSLEVAHKAQEVHGVVAMYSNTLAKALKEIKAKELWKEDGFKGVGDFAKQTFGVAPATTSTLIKTAERFTLGDGSVGFEGLEGQSAYNLYFLSPYSDEQLKAAIVACEISGNSSQRDIKEWVAAHPVEIQSTEPGPSSDSADSVDSADSAGSGDSAAAVKVAPTYLVTFRYGAATTLPEEMTEAEIESRVKELFPCNSCETAELKPMKLDDGQKLKRRVYTIDDGGDVFGAVMVFYRLKSVPKATKTVAKTVSFTDMSDDELMAELERRRAAKAAPADVSAKAAARVAAAGKASIAAHTNK